MSPGAAARPAPLRVPAFVVVSGGADGAAYLRQLLRACAAGRLETPAIHVVDRDPRCAAAACADARLRLEVADWDAWLDARLADFPPDAQLVPYHWAPHLLRAWLERRLAAAGVEAAPGGRVPPRGLPFEGDTGQGDRALSYASWVCPRFCVEPALCPHTRGARSWSLAADLAAPAPGLADSVVFRCVHLIWGVATIPIGEILAAPARTLAALERGPRRYLVATASHCHGLAAALELRRAR